MANAEWVSKACQELGQAHRRGELDRQTLQYELAKISLEIIDQYGPLAHPSKPVKMRSFEGLNQSDLKRFSKAEYEQARQEYDKEREKWLSACASIRGRNRSNRAWLEEILTALEFKNHPKTDAVRQVLNDHDYEERAYEA